MEYMNKTVILLIWCFTQHKAQHLMLCAFEEWDSESQVICCRLFRRKLSSSTTEEYCDDHKLDIVIWEGERKVKFRLIKKNLRNKVLSHSTLKIFCISKVIFSSLIEHSSRHLFAKTWLNTWNASWYIYYQCWDAFLESTVTPTIVKVLTATFQVYRGWVFETQNIDFSVSLT